MENKRRNEISSWERKSQKNLKGKGRKMERLKMKGICGGKKWRSRDG
jgi:hypothetical protein